MLINKLIIIYLELDFCNLMAFRVKKMERATRIELT